MRYQFSGAAAAQMKLAHVVWYRRVRCESLRDSILGKLADVAIVAGGRADGDEACSD
jgi:hypothetical protein